MNILDHLKSKIVECPSDSFDLNCPSCYYRWTNISGNWLKCTDVIKREYKMKITKDWGY